MRRLHFGLMLSLVSTVVLAAALSSGCSSPAEPSGAGGSTTTGGSTATSTSTGTGGSTATSTSTGTGGSTGSGGSGGSGGTEKDGGPDAMDDAPEVGPPDGGGPGPFTFPPHPSDVVFDPDKLHQVELTVDPAKLAQLDSDLDNRVPCSITYDGVAIDNAGLVKIADNGAVDPLSGKPSFSVKVDAFDPSKDLFTMSRINLESSISDPSMLRQHLGYEMYRRAGIAAKRTAHASVTFNGTVLGVYLVTDAIDKRFTGRFFGPMNNDGNLYEAGCCGDFVDGVPHMDLKNEKSEGRSRVDILALEKALKTAQDQDFAAKVDKRMDLSGFITGYALDALLIHPNGYHYPPIQNFWMYDNPADSRFVFIPSGMVDLFGDLNASPYAKPADFPSKRIRTIPALDAEYRQAVLHVLYDLWDTDFLHARIDKVTAALDSDMAMDMRTLADLAAYKAHVADTHLAVDLRKAKVLAASGATCGNGVIEGFEECDDQNQAAGDGCGPSCNEEYCGDGIVQPGLGEVCDGSGCTPDCSSMATCGNMIKEPGEECDDGDLASGDGCSVKCQLEDCTLVSDAGKSYAFCTAPRTAYEARGICQAAGGMLFAPQNDAENTWAQTTAFGLLGQGYWIGVDDEALEGAYKKPDGSAQAYLPWAAGQPNGGGTQNCLILSFVLAGGWNDKACTDQNGYICLLP